MAISTATATTSNSAAYTSTNSTAITNLTLCNYSASTVTVSVHVVPSGGSAGNDNIMLKDLSITAGDTYILYSGAEKLLLDNNDFISFVCTANSAVTSVVSYTTI